MGEYDPHYVVPQAFNHNLKQACPKPGLNQEQLGWLIDRLKRQDEGHSQAQPEDPWRAMEARYGTPEPITGTPRHYPNRHNSSVPSTAPPEPTPRENMRAIWLEQNEAKRQCQGHS